ncbi:MAG: SUF system NifU family Fe-S cluster assembly protein [Candidatus Sumerlaeota bacterium]|nr:SUF system NifU family Fe-S cluster assembly protein [Candidatus Sumerlaeota bacterium]
MPELREIYQEVILDHNKNPRNRRCPPEANRIAVGHNPLCGDKITLYLLVEDGVIRDVGYEGSGCAISTASASMMSEAVKGKTVEEAEALFCRFHALMMACPQGAENGRRVELGKLRAFAGVREFPIRVKCATLAWHTLEAALKNSGETVSTETGSE